ncbi:hypothetical protein BD410DRAFT_746760 [Rickenella mellea]|uniref:S-adenosyl-L-methionine-dependent methyltransferase n=1 Tax=Rickenella mellea TaxID=50990 RepID=A0A4Y7Q7R6_9AGAM|nr:hypothetical protein BD410DRAFT_746760 [Rickenella mellea]
MKLSTIFGLFGQLRFAIQVSTIPTLRVVFREPSLLLRPRTISRLFMAKAWESFGHFCDMNGRADKEALLTPNAYGVVLDLGAGHGHTVNYLDHSRVSKYIALEPNTFMHEHIRKMAEAAGYSEEAGSLVILSCGAEDIPTIIRETGRHGVDSLVSVLTLCSVPDPAITIHDLVEKILKPGGKFLFYEHVRSPQKDVVWLQNIWSPIWSTFFDGCSLGRDTVKYINDAGRWSMKDTVEKVDEDPENLFWHEAGKYVKAEGEEPQVVLI